MIDRWLGDEKLMNFGVDSLAAVSISSTLKSEFSVNIPPTLFFDQNLSVEKMLAIIEDAKNSSVQEKKSSFLGPQQLFQENLQKFFENSKKLNHRTENDVIFLTGATGFLGLHLLSGKS